MPSGQHQPQAQGYQQHGLGWKRRRRFLPCGLRAAPVGNYRQCARVKRNPVYKKRPDMVHCHALGATKKVEPQIKGVSNIQGVRAVGVGFHTRFTGDKGAANSVEAAAVCLHPRDQEKNRYSCACLAGVAFIRTVISPDCQFSEPGRQTNNN